MLTWQQKFWFRTRLIRATATPADHLHRNVLRLHVQSSLVQRLIGRAINLLPSPARVWTEARFPEWAFPPRLVLKRQKKGWAREFNTEKAVYARLRPLQDVVIPRYFGELSYRNRRAMLLSDVGGESLATPEGTLVQLSDFRRLLFQALNAFTPFRISHCDSKLDNYHLTGDKIMIVDLERIAKGFATEHEMSIFVQGKVDYLAGHYRELQHHYWETGLIAIEEG